MVTFAWTRLLAHAKLYIMLTYLSFFIFNAVIMHDGTARIRSCAPYQCLDQIHEIGFADCIARAGKAWTATVKVRLSDSIHEAGSDWKID